MLRSAQFPVPTKPEYQKCDGAKLAEPLARYLVCWWANRRKSQLSDRFGNLLARMGCFFVFASVLGLGLGMPSHLEAKEIQWELQSAHVPKVMGAGQEYAIDVVIRNIGQEAWSEQQGDHFSYHWRKSDGSILLRDGLRTSFQGEVEPGAEIRLVARVLVPQDVGIFELEWAMVREHVSWYPLKNSVPSTRTKIEIIAPFTAPFTDQGKSTWSIEEFEFPSEIAANSRVTGTIKLKNLGALPWSNRSHDRLAYHWWDREGQLVEFEGIRSNFLRDVPSGESEELRMHVRAPGSPGLYFLQPALVQESLRWIESDGFGPWDFVQVKVGEPRLAWKLNSGDIKEELAAGDVLRVEVDLENTGLESWGDRDHLSYHWIDAKGKVISEGPRSDFSESVEPGQSTTIMALVAAPKKPGRYRLVWGMVREHVQWFDERPLFEKSYSIQVLPKRLQWDLIISDQPSFLTVNGMKKIRVVLRNTGTSAWSPELRDRLSYHWLDVEGNVVQFDGIRTDLTKEVLPGQEIELNAQVIGPERSGRFQLRWEMLREHVGWYGPSTSKQGQTLGIYAIQFVSLLHAFFALISVFLLYFLWRRKPSTTWALFGAELAILLWAWLSIVVISFTFLEISQISPQGRLTSLVLSGACLWLIPATLGSGSWRRIAIAFSVAFAGFCMLADLVYVQFFGSIVPVSSILWAHQLGNLGASIDELIEPIYWWITPLPGVALAAVVLWSIHWLRFRRQRRSVKVPGRQWRYIVPVAIACVGSVPVVRHLDWMLSDWTGFRVWSETRSIERFGVLNAHIFDCLRTVREQWNRGRLKRDTRQEIDKFVEEHHREIHENRPAGFGVAKGANLLLIQIEAAQEWVIGTQVDGQEITPYLNQASVNGLYYPNVIDQTAEGTTSDAEYLVLNSKLPLARGALAFLRADNNFFTLAHQLKGQGYSTLSAHPFHRGFWNRAILHQSYGFDRSLFRKDLGRGLDVGWGLADGIFFSRIVPEIEKLSEPWFAFLITLSLHHPFDHFPDQLKQLDLGELEDSDVGNYLHAMNYFDRSLVELMADLRIRGLLDHTVVAVYGDHDARFILPKRPQVLELANIDHLGPSTFHRLERIPLAIFLPDSTIRGEVSSIAGHMDMGPTLLHYLGVEAPKAFLGHPIDDNAPNFAAYPDGSAYAPDRFFIIKGNDIPRNGGCFHWPNGQSRSREDCDAIESQSAQLLKISRSILDHNLARRLQD